VGQESLGGSSRTEGSSPAAFGPAAWAERSVKAARSKVESGLI
jgi:hypothetical protein